MVKCTSCNFIEFTSNEILFSKFIDFSSSTPKKNLSKSALICSLSIFERFVYNYITDTYPNNSKINIIELFPESGRLLLALSKNYKNVIGFDPLRNHVEALTKSGLKAFLMKNNYFTDVSFTPDLIIICESLVRLNDPFKFIDQVVKAFPKAILIITLPHQLRSIKVLGNEQLSYSPPHSFTRWDLSNIKLFFSRFYADVSCGHIDISISDLSDNFFIGLFIKNLLRINSEQHYSNYVIAKQAKTYN